MIKNCYMRHENGNCLPAGGFCTANKNICEALHNAYEMGKSEQRIGKWIPSDSQCGIRCSVCGVPVDDFCHSIDYIDLDYEPNFCPNCGLPMKGANNAGTEI